MESIIVLCPAHDINDRRINRTNSIISRKYSIQSFYELSYKLEDAHVNDSIHYIKGKRDYFKVKSIIEQASLSSESNISVYIHDSGIFGLLLCWWWSKNKKVGIITFDYHDWIPWEVFYQVKKKIKSRFLVKGIAKMILWFCSIFFSSMRIKNLVGISKEQLDSFKAEFGLKNTRDLVIPNTRKKISERKIQNAGSEFHGVLWVGNVMRGRDLDILCDFVKRYNENNSKEIGLYLVGNVYDTVYLEELKSRLKITYLKPFKSDSDILEMIQPLNLAGFFYGWDDVFKTDINRIASPNKAYTYLNIGIPTIMGEHMESLKASVENDDKTIFWIEDYKGFEDSIKYIGDNYNSIIENFDVKTKWEDDIVKKIVDFF